MLFEDIDSLEEWSNNTTKKQWEEEKKLFWQRIFEHRRKAFAKFDREEIELVIYGIKCIDGIGYKLISHHMEGIERSSGGTFMNMYKNYLAFPQNKKKFEIVKAIIATIDSKTFQLGHLSEILCDLPINQGKQPHEFEFPKGFANDYTLLRYFEWWWNGRRKDPRDE